jgi:phosphoglycolate phosphatase-like HAD superfamily hydrolase
MINIKDLDNYDLILLDCDGVIFDTNYKKINFFLECVKEYDPEVINNFRLFLLKNFGKSRYYMFDYFFKNLLSYDNEKIDFKLQCYAEKCKKMYLEVNFTDGFLDFMQKYNQKKIIVLSGNDENELKDIFMKRNTIFFSDILGSPSDKSLHFYNLKKKYDKRKIIFIGDSTYDYNVANDNEVDFLLMKKFSIEDPSFFNDKTFVNSFEEL